MNPTQFSIWMRSNLKDAFSGLITQDLDFIVTKTDGHYFIVEEKIISKARTGPAQAIIYKLLDDVLSSDNLFEGCHKLTVDDDQLLYVNQTEKRRLDHFLSNPRSNYRNEFNQTWFDKIIYFSLQYLWDCKGAPYIRKTERERTFERNSNLKPLLLKNNVKFASIDWLFVNYCTGNFAILFESKKTDNTIIDRIVANFEKHNSSSVRARNPKSNAPYRFLGIYEISYNSKLTDFTINGHKIDYRKAISVLNLDDDSITSFKY